MISPADLTVLVAHNAYRQRGGEDIVVDAEIDLLRSFGHEVVEYRRDNAEIGEALPIGLPRNTLWSTRAAKDIDQLIRERRPDVIHAHNTFPLLSPAIYWAAASANVPVVQTLHNFRLLCAQGTFLRNGKICEDCLGTLPWRGVVRKCYRGSGAQSAALVAMLAVHRSIGTYRQKVSRYIALSEFSRRKFIDGGMPADKIVVKPNFVAAPVDRKLARARGLFVGRLSAEKGLQVLAEASRILPEAGLDVIGTGPLRSLLETAAGIRLLGWQGQDAVQQKMREAAYLVMPSICYEQFPRTLVEAFACGLPVIASRLGPLTELIEDGHTGLLFDAGSPRDLAEKMNFAARNPDQLQRMGRNARTEYDTKYTPERNYRQLTQIYAEVANLSAY